MQLIGDGLYLRTLIGTPLPEGLSVDDVLALLRPTYPGLPHFGSHSALEAPPRRDSLAPKCVQGRRAVAIGTRSSGHHAASTTQRANSHAITRSPSTPVSSAIRRANPRGSARS